MTLAGLGMMLIVLCIAGVVLDMFFEFDLRVCRWIALSGIVGAGFIAVNFFYILSQ